MLVFLPGIIMGFREGLEAFLIVTMILRYLSKINQSVFIINRFLKNMFGKGLLRGYYYL